MVFSFKKYERTFVPGGTARVKSSLWGAIAPGRHSRAAF